MNAGVVGAVRSLPRVYAQSTDVSVVQEEARLFCCLIPSCFNLLQGYRARHAAWVLCCCFPQDMPSTPLEWLRQEG